MSEAAFTDSTTPTASPAFTLRPAFGGSTNTMSPSCSCAWSVMPTETVPSASRWGDVFFGRLVPRPRSVDENPSVADEGRLQDLRGERLVAHLHAHEVA